MIGGVYGIIGAAVAATIALGTAYFQGKSAGADAAQSKWLQQHDKDLAEANRRLQEAFRAKAEKEKSLREEINTLSEIKEAQTGVLTNETNRVLARNRALDRSLRECRTATSGNANGGVPGTSGAAGGRHGGAASDLSAADGEFLIRFAAEADAVALQLAQCQKTLDVLAGRGTNRVSGKIKNGG